MWPPTSNSAHFCSMARAHSFSSSSSIFSLRSAVRSRVGGGSRKFVLPCAIFGSAPLFRGAGGLRLVELDHRGPCAASVRLASSSSLAVSSSSSHRCLRRDSLLRHRRTPGDLDFLHSLAQAFRFALLAPFLDASDHLADDAARRVIGFFIHAKRRAERKAGGQKSAVSSVTMTPGSRPAD